MALTDLANIPDGTVIDVTITGCRKHQNSTETLLVLTNGASLHNISLRDKAHVQVDVKRPELRPGQVWEGVKSDGTMHHYFVRMLSSGLVLHPEKGLILTSDEFWRGVNRPRLVFDPNA